MRVSLGLPTHRVDAGAEFVSAEGIGGVARAAEAAGFDAVYVTDHPFPPAKWLRGGGHHTLDPMVALAFAAAATTTLRLQTNLFVAAYRNPFIAAKAVSSLDHLSGGRVILGVGAGYLAGEFAALGVDFDARNDLLDEAIVAMRAAWSGEPVSVVGGGYSAADNVMAPPPARPGGPPIWVGGNSKRAIRRAVDLGDGWVPMPSSAAAATHLRTPGLETLDDLAARLGYARGYAAEVGRTAPLDVCFMPAGLDGFADAGLYAPAVIEAIAAMAEVGVTYAAVALPGNSRSELVASIETFGTEILPAVADL